jgi:hypothetical protein
MRIPRHTAPGRVIAALVWLTLVTGAAAAHAQEPKSEELSLFIKEQQTYNPGYAVGDIAIGEPGIADFKVLNGRRELLLFGKGVGETKLTIWDQKRVKRSEVHIIVRSREDVKAEADLKDLLKDFPTVEVRRLGSKLIVSGVVSSQADLDAVGRLASAASAESVVRYVKPAGPGGVAVPAGPGGVTAPGGPVAAPAAQEVEYEVELLEANVAFASGTYGRGIEPSGRSLFKQTVHAPIGGEVNVNIPGPAVSAPVPDDGKKQQKPKKGEVPPPVTPTTLNLKVRPTQLAETGEITTFVLIETNLPVEGSMDPSISRRARWELSSNTGEPFGIAGAELLAMPAVARNPSKLPRVLETAAMLPGANRGTGYVPSYVVYYDKNKKTQLLAVFRPRLVAAAGRE